MDSTSVRTVPLARFPTKNSVSSSRGRLPNKRLKLAARVE